MSVDNTIQSLKDHLKNKKQYKKEIRVEFNTICDKYYDLSNSKSIFDLPLKNIFDIIRYSQIKCYYHLNVIGLRATFFDVFEHGSIESLDYLISNGFDVNSTNKDGYPPILLSIISDRNDLYEYLLTKGAHMKNFPNIPKPKMFEKNIKNAIQKHNFTSFLYLMQNNTKYNNDLKSITRITIENGALPFLQYLIDAKNANFTYEYNNGEQSLHVACSRPNLKIVEYLINHRINTSINEMKIHVIGSEALIFIQKFFEQNNSNQHLNIDYLSNYQMKIYVNGLIVPIVVTESSEDEFISLRIKNYKESDAFILLYSIDDRGTFEILETNYKESNTIRNGKKAPIIICGNNCEKDSERVVQKNEGEQIAQKLNATFFETSVVNNYNITDAFKFLIKETLRSVYKIDTNANGVNVLGKNNDGDTLIHIAAKNGHLPIVQYLIEKQHIDSDIKGHDDQTPYDYTVQNDHREVSAYLITKKF